MCFLFLVQEIGSLMVSRESACVLRVALGPGSESESAQGNKLFRAQIVHRFIIGCVQARSKTKCVSGSYFIVCVENRVCRIREKKARRHSDLIAQSHNSACRPCPWSDTHVAFLAVRVRVVGDAGF